MMNNSQCVILVPANSGIEPACDHGLRQLERMGYPVWRVPGFAAIDAARSQLATDAVARGFEELMWIDSDIEFDPAAVERLRSTLIGEQGSGVGGRGSEGSEVAIVSGLYPKKGTRALASSLLPETQVIIFGEAQIRPREGDSPQLAPKTPQIADGPRRICSGVFEIRYAATGFLLTKRQVYIDIQRQLNLPVCNQQFNKPLVPFFWPMVIDDDAAIPGWEAEKQRPSPRPSPIRGEGERASGSPLMRRPWYLSEDFSFSHRARLCGYKIYADSTIRLGHIGRYTYAWEDAGMTLPRYGRFEFHVADAKPAD